MSINHDQMFLSFPLPDHLVAEEFFESFTQFSILKRGYIFDGRCGRSEPVQRFMLESVNIFKKKANSSRQGTYSLLAFSGDSNSFHKSALSSLAESVTLKRQ